MDANLPNNQNDQSNNQPPTDQVQDQTYGLNFQPQAPAGSEVVPIIEHSPQQVETVSEIQQPTETLHTPEIETPIPMPTAAQLQDDPTAVVVSLTTKKDEPKVVDKTDTLTTLHHVIDTPDLLTKEADEDEERFIEEVEKHHEHQ